MWNRRAQIGVSGDWEFLQGSWNCQIIDNSEYEEVLHSLQRHSQQRYASIVWHYGTTYLHMRIRVLFSSRRVML